ncbi:MAG: hypothetical protein CL489_05005 [Acidobacteria bacterium]|jgi:hypothetical protein|nr:hypothetical protein [Acidobacteriota bacterium]|tara:strand:+ start:928 stop:1488 length:561 start_codon:yes stop_codon:yes gene_type:complete
MAAGVINGTPIHDKVHIHARTKFTQIYAVDITHPHLMPRYQNEIDDIAIRFVEFSKKNEFVNKVLKLNGLVQRTYPKYEEVSNYHLKAQLEIFDIHTDFQISPVTIPNLILVFGIHLELCVLDHAESIKQRFPHAQVLILNDLCESKYANLDKYNVLFNYCLRAKCIDYANTNNLVIIDEDTKINK